MKRNFFYTEFATYAGLELQIPNVIKYTTEHRYCILSAAEADRMAGSIRMILTSPLSQFFNRICSVTGLQTFALLNITDKNDTIPELLTSNSLTLDIRQAEDTINKAAIPEVRNKVLVNVTGCIKLNKYTGQYEINSVDLFQQLLVRGQLTMSYYDNLDWLNPVLSEFVVRSYSMILSNMIARYHDLTLLDQMRIAGILAFYYCQLLYSGTNKVTDPPIFNRCTFLGSRADLLNIQKLCNDYAPDGLSIVKVAELITASGPERLHNFTVSELNVLCGSLGTDNLTTLISLEYPPYWVYLLVLALSGAKIPLIFQLNNQKLLNEGKSKFLNTLLTSVPVFNTDRT